MAGLVHLRLEDSLVSDLADILAIVLADSLDYGLLSDDVLGASLLGTSGLPGDSGEHIVLRADGLLAHRRAGAGGLFDRDLDDVFVGGAGLLAQRGVLDLDVGGGNSHDSLMGLALRSGLERSRDDLPVDSGRLVVALPGVDGVRVVVGFGDGSLDHDILLDHGAGGTALLVPNGRDGT